MGCGFPCVAYANRVPNTASYTDLFLSHVPRTTIDERKDQCGKHHRAPEGAQPRHAGTPHAGGTRAGGANVPSFPSVPRREEQPPPHSHPPSRSPEQHRDTRLPVRILTPPLFFVPFPRVGRAVGYLVRRTGKQPKRPTPVANFRRRLQNFPAWGFLVIRFFYINCKDALIIPGNSISRAPALLKQ